MDERILKYVPQKKKEAVADAFKDSDGYWIFLKDGLEASNMDSGCHTIHEDTIKELRYQIGGISKL